MSHIILKYLDDCRDPALTFEAKTRLARALIPKAVVGDTLAIDDKSAPTTQQSSQSGEVPTVEVDRSVIDAILDELKVAGADPKTLELLKFLIHTEVYYELQLSTDEQVILALRYLESIGYDAGVVEDCVQILETPSDSEIPNPGAYLELLSESLKLQKYETLAMAVTNYLEQCMAD